MNKFEAITKMKTYILDDDEVQVLHLQSLLNKHNKVSSISAATNWQVAKEEIEATKPELLFLDIDLGSVNGLDLYRSLHHKPLLIITTSHLQYALDGFELDALNYIVKPLSAEKINRSVEKADSYLQSKQLTPNFETQTDYIFIKDNKSLIKITLEDVLYIEALGDFSEIHLESGQKKIALVNLKNFELQLPANFVRISRMHIVNGKKVDAFSNYSLKIKDVELGIGKMFAGTVESKIIGASLIKRQL